MCKTRRHRVFRGDNQPGLVKVRFGQDELLEQIGRNRLQESRLTFPAAPKAGQYRRVSVSERAVGQHEREIQANFQNVEIIDFWIILFQTSYFSDRTYAN